MIHLSNFPSTLKTYLTRTLLRLHSFILIQINSLICNLLTSSFLIKVTSLCLYDIHVLKSKWVLIHFDICFVHAVSFFLSQFRSSCDFVWRIKLKQFVLKLIKLWVFMCCRVIHLFSRLMENLLLKAYLIQLRMTILNIIFQ